MTLLPGPFRQRLPPSAVERHVPALQLLDAKARHEIALAFMRELRGAPATKEETALLQQACDACSDDVETDTLLTPDLTSVGSVGVR